MEGVTKKKKATARNVSQLPEDLIHRILSYLEMKEAARTAIVCKTLYSAWLTCPTLNIQLYSSSDLFEEFFTSVNKIFLRYQQQKICILQLIICVSIDDYYSASLINKWIEISVQNGVQKLKLEFLLEYDFPFTLPNEAKTLEELTVSGKFVKLRKGVNDKVMFTHLHKLKFTSVYIDDETFQDIIASCPLINKLYLHNCEGLKRIKVSGVYHLQKFSFISSDEKVLITEIEGPLLQSLNLSFVITSIFLDTFVQKLPQVVDLRLFQCNVGERIHITSPSLKRIRLTSIYTLREIKIDAPNLVLFELLYMNYLPDQFLINASSQWVSKISMDIVTDACQFFKLKRILEKLMSSKISLALWNFFKDVQENVSVSPIIKVEELELGHGFGTRMSLSSCVDALFFTCRPNFIIVSRFISFYKNKNFSKFLYEILIKRRNQENYEHNLWYQDLKEVKFEVYDHKNKDWYPSTWNKLSWPPKYPDDKVRFRLKWEAA